LLDPCILICGTKPKDQVRNTDKFCIFNNPARTSAIWLHLAAVAVAAAATATAAK